MLILLPPSEGKTAPRRGKPLDLSALTLPGLTPARERVLDALIGLCTVDGEPQFTAEQAALNVRLRSAPTAVAERVYTGVLYEALDVATLSPPAHRLLKKSVLIFSGLWGVVGLGDRIPAYRCSAGVTLPGLGGVGSYWRKALPLQLDKVGLVIDLRSGPYAAMWAPPPGRSAKVRVLHERAGTRTVVSHFNKATKGRLLRDLAIAGAQPRSVDELVTTLRDLKYTIEREEDRVDVIVNEL